MPPNEERRARLTNQAPPPPTPTSTLIEAGTSHSNGATGRQMPSRQVCWWAVHQFVSPLLERAGSWPMAGTPEWSALADDDPAKWAALLDGARHHALRVETAQQGLAQASRDISAAENWSAIATDIHQRHNTNIPREVA